MEAMSYIWLRFCSELRLAQHQIPHAARENLPRLVAL